MFQQQEKRPVYVYVSVVKRCGVLAVMKMQENSNKKAKTNSPLMYIYVYVSFQSFIWAFVSSFHTSDDHIRFSIYAESLFFQV